MKSLGLCFAFDAEDLICATDTQARILSLNYVFNPWSSEAGLCPRIVQFGRGLIIRLPLPPSCWDSMHVPLCTVGVPFHL